MRIWQGIWLTAAAATLIVACAPAAISPSGGVEIRAGVTAGMHTQAAPKTQTDVAYYRYRLWNTASGNAVLTHETQATSVTFGAVANGTYALKVEAFDAADASITQGGEQTSLNTAVVSAPTVTYSSGSALTVAVPLLDGTGEAIANSVTVTDGNPWAGTPVGEPMP